MIGQTAERRLDGERYLVTGASAGLGYFAAEQVAARGAEVVLAVRNLDKGERARAQILDRVPSANVELLRLDLADLDSIARAAQAIQDGPAVNGVLANAGVVGSARRQNTADGFELQVGTNHLGHFALIARLLPFFDEHATRMVHLGSISHRWARLSESALNAAPRYVNARAYATSKLAVMTFGFELARRLEESRSRAQSVVAHPGLSINDLAPTRGSVIRHPRRPNPLSYLPKNVVQGKDKGALPLVHALTEPLVYNGDYWGPGGWGQLTGYPALVSAKKKARDRDQAARLIEYSERATGVRLGI